MKNTFGIVKKGYNPEEVDKYIEELETVIKSYREKDVAIKNALVNAQIAADNIIKNAEIEADTYKLKAVEKLTKVKSSVLVQKNHLDEFKLDYNRLINKYLKDFNEFDLISVESKLDELEDYLNDVIADKNNESLDETKVVKSIKDEYNSSLADEGRIPNGEKIRVTTTSDSIILTRDDDITEKINREFDNKAKDINEALDIYTHDNVKNKKN